MQCITVLTWPPVLIEATLVNYCAYTSHAAAHFRSGSPHCFTKDTRLHLLQLKIMASAEAAIYGKIYRRYDLSQEENIMFQSHNIG